MVDGRYQRFSPRGGFADAKKAAQRMAAARTEEITMQNALDAAKFFHLPPNRVVEIGVQIQF